jgi:hypothetical protein
MASQRVQFKLTNMPSVVSVMRNAGKLKEIADRNRQVCRVWFFGVLRSRPWSRVVNRLFLACLCCCLQRRNSDSMRTMSMDVDDADDDESKKSFLPVSRSLRLDDSVRTSYPTGVAAAGVASVGGAPTGQPPVTAVTAVPSRLVGSPLGRTK